MVKRGLAFTCAAMLLAAPQVRDVPREPTGTASIAGIVTATDAAKTPLRRARVNVTGGRLLVPRIATTDDTGRFTLGDLPAGQYTLSASKLPYLTMNFGASRPNRAGTSIVLNDGQEITNVRIALPPGAAISGRITTPGGEPVPDAAVSLMQSRRFKGDRRFLGIQAALTDDRGQYRFFGLEAGDYLVSASTGTGVQIPADIVPIAEGEVDLALQAARQPVVAAVNPAPRARPIGIAPVFYPGTANGSQAVTITVGTGEDRDGVDFSAPNVQTARVDGTISIGGGRPLPPTTQVTLRPLGTVGDDVLGTSARTLLSPHPTDPNGRFVFNSVPPGEYVVIASTQARGGRGATASPADTTPLTAFATVMVNGTDQTVDLTLGPGMTVAGRFEFEGTAAPSSLAGATLSFEDLYVSPVGQNQMYTAELASDRQFRINWLTPGRYTISNASDATRRLPPAGWALKSVVAGGRELLDAPFELQPTERLSDVVATFTDHPSMLTGTLQGPSGAPTSDYYILVFPTDRRFWFPNSRRITSARPNTSGAYGVRNLPAGDYFIAALTDVEDGEWFDPEFLQSLLATSPVRLTIADGEQKRQDLQIRR